MGTFQSVSFVEEFKHPGVLGESYRAKVLKVEKAGAGRKRVTYRYEGKVVFRKAAFRSNDVRAVPLRLPLSPDLIYQLGLVRGMNRCTDEHYNEEGDFWYFWDPQLKGCPLADDNEEVLRIRGRLEMLPNTERTFPEYDQLYGDNGNGKVFEIAVFYGYIDDLRSVNAANRRDDAFHGMNYLHRDLRERGFELVEKVDEFRQNADGRRSKGAGFLRIYEKPVMALGREILVRVQVLLADTYIESTDKTFRRFLIPAYEKSDVIIYDGHSGLGDYLDLMHLPQVGWDRSKYQIIFFNGCSSYPYYNGNYMKAKGGSRKLDVVTSGLPTFSTTAGPNAVAFLDRFLEGKTSSWQKILSELELSNADNGTYLTGVNGDEDNRFVP